MMSTKKGIVLALFLMVFASLAFAEPSYLIYPNAPAVFRYDTHRYELLSPGDPKFDSDYSIGNHMLWDRVEGRVPVEIYGAPSIIGFEPSPTGMNEFVTSATISRSWSTGSVRRRGRSAGCASVSGRTQRRRTSS